MDALARKAGDEVRPASHPQNQGSGYAVHESAHDDPDLGRQLRPSAIRAVSICSRCTTAAAPQSAIISMPIEAISIEMKWSRSPMSKRRASAT